MEEALAFIADRLEGEGRFGFMAQFHDAAAGRNFVEQLSYQASNVAIDSNRCRISFRWLVEEDRRATPVQERAVELRLAKSITVETIDQALTDLNLAAGRPYSVFAYPKVYAVRVERWDKPAADYLYFHDREMAERVAAAAKHALELCEDGARRPFPYR